MERKAVSTIQKDDLDRDASDRIASGLRKDLIGMKKRSEIRDGAAFRYKLPSERPIAERYIEYTCNSTLHGKTTNSAKMLSSV